MLEHKEAASPLGRDHPERPARLVAIMARLRETGLLARCKQVGLDYFCVVPAYQLHNLLVYKLALSTLSQFECTTCHATDNGLQHAGVW